MFIVSKARGAVYHSLLLVALIVGVYWLAGVLTTVAAFVFSAGVEKNVDFTSPETFIATLNLSSLYTPRVVAFLTPVVLLLVGAMFFARSYRKRAVVLEIINESLAKIPELQKVGGCVSYSYQGAFGPETTTITCVEADTFTLVRTGKNVFGTDTVSSSFITVFKTGFSSSDGASYEVMSIFSGVLLLAKEHSKPRTKRQKRKAV